MGAMSVFIADVNRDGRPDILSASAGDNKIAWYQNQGGGSFSAGTNVTTTAQAARSVWAGDLDGDGDIDILSASLDDNKIAWYDNNGSQSFTLRTISTTVNGAISVAAADLDGDGDLDVVAAAYFGDSVVWYENRSGQVAVATTSIAPVGISREPVGRRPQDRHDPSRPHRRPRRGTRQPGPAL